MASISEETSLRSCGLGVFWVFPRTTAISPVGGGSYGCESHTACVISSTNARPTPHFTTALA